MSFFKKIATDAVSFKQKKKKKEAKGKNKFDNTEEEETSQKERGTMMKFVKCNGLHFGTNYSYSCTNIINNGVQNSPNSEDYNSTTAIPKDIEDNFSRLEKPTVYQFWLVSQNIKNGSKPLGLQLGFTESELENYSSEAEEILRLLLDWQKAKTREGSVGRLLKSLWDAGEHDAAKRLSEDILSNSNSM